MFDSEKAKAELLKEFPNVKFVTKTSFFWKTLDFFVKVITFWNNKTFLTRYTTTIGTYIALPSEWDSFGDFTKTAVLKHERIHLRQQKKCGFGSIWFGLIPWGFFWLLFPLPFGLAWGRYYLERQAYLENIKHWGEVYGTSTAEMALDHAVLSMTGSGYCWCWPFKKSVRDWFYKNSGLDGQQLPAA